MNKKILISINGDLVWSYKSIEVKQLINDHHRFVISIDLPSESHRYTHNLENHIHWLGGNLCLYIGTTANLWLSGIVSNVRLSKNEGDLGSIILEGLSKTYLLENAPTYRSWINSTLEDILQDLLQGVNIYTKINPRHNSKLDYECQYNESDFTFIRRLARQYNEWFYYDGQALFLGKPEVPAPIKLEYGVNLNSMEVGVQTIARPSSFFSYHSGMDYYLEKDTPEEPYGLGYLGSMAFQRSLEIFRKPSNQRTYARIDSVKGLEDYAEERMFSDAAESYYITGGSECMDLTVGSIVEIRHPVIDATGSLSYMGMANFLITEITHISTEGLYYKNYFKGVPAGVKYLPTPEVSFPVAETQMAVVLRNDDPMNKGRVQVQMNWQKKGLHTNWIRVMTPDGGISEKVETNRGFVFIPEIGDQVLVGFRYNDPNRPYVLGSLFNGVTGSGRAEDNIIKSLTTRSGVALSMNDSKGSLSLCDSSGVNMIFDGKGNSTNRTPKNHTVNVGEKLSMLAGKDLSSFILDNNGIVELNGLESITLKVGDSKIKVCPNEVSIESTNIHIKGGHNTISGENKLTGGDTTIDGGVINLN